MHNYTIECIRKILKDDYNHNNPAASFFDLISTKMLMSYKKNDVIIQQMDEAKYFYFLLKGKVSVINSISWTNGDVIDTLSPLNIMGLTEKLNNVPTYTASVVANEHCVVMRVPADEYISLISKDAQLCFDTLKLLGKITTHNMSRAETGHIFYPLDRLGYYLFSMARNNVPYVCSATRKELSSSLYINLRTLYRYLDSMEENGYISINKGKIVIDKENLKKLDERYGSIVL
ncbi:MAG: Crp/Fnr family transcriptional regulator [Lachnospiraceae bacterium]|nr:Crp/Fnr family transcriptional regulator [Lachnospiraceae bacterium]